MRGTESLLPFVADSTPLQPLRGTLSLKGRGDFLALLMVFLTCRGPLRGRRVGVCAQGATGQGWPVEGRGDTMSPRHDPEHTPPPGDRPRRGRRTNQGVLFWVTFFAQAKTVTPSGERAQAFKTRRPSAVAPAKKRLNVRHRFRGKSRPRLRCGRLSPDPGRRPQARGLKPVATGPMPSLRQPRAPGCALPAWLHKGRRLPRPSTDRRTGRPARY